MADENVTASENTNETTEQATTPAVKASKPAVPSPGFDEAPCSEPRGLRQESSTAHRSDCRIHRASPMPM